MSTTEGNCTSFRSVATNQSKWPSDFKTYKKSVKVVGISPVHTAPEAEAGQSAGMGVHVCKSVCIEVKISGRKVADHRNLVLRFTLMTQHNQQPPVHLFSPLYTRTYIHEPPFRHSDGHL